MDILLPEEVVMGEMGYRYPTTHKSTTNPAHTYPTYNVLEKITELRDIRNHCRTVILNAPGAAWDLFTFLDVSESGEGETLCIVGQVKKASHESANPLIINQKLILGEYGKAAKAVLKLNSTKWIFLFLTDAETGADLNILDMENVAFVGQQEFKYFFGHSYASRAQFTKKHSYGDEGGEKTIKHPLNDEGVEKRDTKRNKMSQN